MFGRHNNCNEFAKAVGHYVCSKILLFRAELKLRGYYLEHDFYLDRVIFTNMSHVYYLDQQFFFHNEACVLFGLSLVLSESRDDKIPNSRQGSVY